MFDPYPKLKKLRRTAGNMGTSMSTVKLGRNHDENIKNGTIPNNQQR
jgi:hypothetical protein